MDHGSAPGGTKAVQCQMHERIHVSFSTFCFNQDLCGLRHSSVGE